MRSASRIPQTLFLMVTALSLAVIIGIPIGVITAVKQYSKIDYALNGWRSSSPRRRCSSWA